MKLVENRKIKEIANNKIIFQDLTCDSLLRNSKSFLERLDIFSFDDMG